jgi:hypothetical protein
MDASGTLCPEIVPNSMALVIIPPFREIKPMRTLYLFNIETGERGEQIDVTDMRPIDIVVQESKLWASIEDPWVVRDSENDILRDQ